MDGSSFGRGMEAMLNGLLITCLISVPLGLWKLVEIVIWLWRHVSIDWN